MVNIFEEWDRAAIKDFRRFSTGALLQISRFSQRQAEVLSDLINNFVDDADRWQKMCIKDPDPCGKARSELDRLLKGTPPDENCGFLRRLIFGDTSRAEDKFIKFLPGDDAVEAMKLFAGRSTETGESVDSETAIDVAIAEHIMDEGALAVDLLDLMMSSDKLEGGDTGVSPKCITDGLSSDLLSGEECTLKKIAALHRLITATVDDEEARKHAPVVAIGSARAAYKEVVEAKSKVRGARLLALQAMLEKDLDEEAQDE